ncbi:MAG: uracil phosphoribosyltransferase [Ruminiclostridium sp.]|nr:uracil phosphoribosyltransferase [Ruminiclostridium sp.]
MYENERLHILDHPLLQHKITLLRDKNTGSKEFRELVEEVTMFMTYEATRDLPLKQIKVQTPIAIANSNVISGRKVAFVPVLRAGLGMVDGATALVPAAKVGHIGICRADSQPDGLQVYYNKLPFDIEEREVIILDLMIGSGRTAAKAVDAVKDAGAKTVKIITVVTCPEGIEYLHEKHPDVDIYCGALDDHLNEDQYIVPGIGDGGDRIFGTK